MKPLRDLFADAVLASTEVPQIAKDRIGERTAIEEHAFDETYIDFLAEQIELNARGDEWSDRLRKRSRHCLMDRVSRLEIRGPGKAMWRLSDRETRFRQMPAPRSAPSDSE